jgi:hypothetical protein
MKVVLRDFAPPMGVLEEEYPVLVETDTGHKVGEKDIPWRQDFKPLSYRYYIWSHSESRTISIDSRFIIETREGLMSMATLYGHRYDATGPIAVVFFAKNLADSVLLLNQFCVTDLPHSVETEKTGRLGIIAHHCEEAEPFNQRWLAKRELMALLNINDSVAGLEKQVDLLSELVFSMLDQQSAMPSWAEGFKLKMREFTSATPADIDSIANDKRYLRELVGSYKRSRSGA